MPRYRIVPEQSQVWIDATSNVHPIHSRTEGLQGELDLTFGADGTLDLDAPVVGALALPVDRLRSSNPLQDRELRRRIDAKHFATIDGALTAIGAAAEAGRYAVEGDVTFRGVANRYADELEIALAGDGSVRLAGRAAFDLRDFGMEPPKILVLHVDPIVTVRIEVVATRRDSHGRATPASGAAAWQAARRC